MTRVYWRGLDGLRGAAILAVMLFHAGIGWARGGFLGVDVFFVLSGFLITSLLLAEWRLNGGISFRAFYLRRFLRLYPALVVVVAAVGVPALVLGAGHIVIGGLLSLVYATNIWIDHGHETGLFQHVWTLSIEEQFYLFWPPLLLALLLLHRRARRTGVMAVVGFAGCAGVVWQTLATGSYERTIGLGIGCVLGGVLGGRSRPAFLPILGVIGAATLVALLARASAAGPGATRVDRSTFVVAGLAAAAIVASVVAGREGPLAWEPLVWLGRRSYGLYLWHFPVFDVVNNHALGHAPLAVRAAVQIAVALALAVMSYELVELRFLRLKQRLART